MRKSKTEYEEVSQILVERLAEFIDPTYDIWGVGFEMGLLDQGTEQEPCPYDPMRSSWTANQHAARIRYIAEHLDEMTPIAIDNYCDNRHIYAEPIIIDGHHRFTAAVWWGKKYISASYAGRLDLLDYLTGRSDTRPE